MLLIKVFATHPFVTFSLIKNIKSYLLNLPEFMSKKSFEESYHHLKKKTLKLAKAYDSCHVLGIAYVLSSDVTMTYFDSCTKSLDRTSI